MLEKSKELAIGEIIRQAGEIIRSADYSRLGITQKTGSSNFVTEYDVKVQKYLEAELKKVFPECGFLAEEEGQGENKIGEGYTFVIDPIDGTTNFMLGRRSSVISVGLLKDGKPSRRPSGLRKTTGAINSLAHRTTWLRSDLVIPL